MHYLTRRTHCLLALSLSIACLFFPQFTFAQAAAPAAGAGREKIPLAGPWHFATQPTGSRIEKPGFEDQKWQSVSVPHTWNSKTDAKTRKAAWYRTHFTLGESDRGREIFLSFDGAATVADVYLNGTRLGQHRGAYTRFIFDGTRAALFGGDKFGGGKLGGDKGPGDNVLAVKCDTDPKDTADCLPAGNGWQLYHVYGGLYRRVWLLKTAPVHIDPTDDASSGVYLTPQAVGADRAGLTVKTLVRNEGQASKTVRVSATVQDRDGVTVASTAETLILGPNAGGVSLRRVSLVRPHLWSTADPYLYRVTAAVESDGQTLDSVSERTGFRYFQMSPAGFLLNGVNTPLRGAAKHQETEEHASAVTEDDLRADWDSLTEMGVNFVRLAHYPHAAFEYDQADERGIVVWAENGHSNAAPPTATGDVITREMVKQNYNHPSLCFWSIGNEAILKKSDVETLEHYARTVRAQDTTRLITYASNTAFASDPTLDFVAVNRYLGWYGGYVSDFNAHAAYYHYISETGAGGVISTHTADAVPTHIVNAYEPEEYQQDVAESRCQAVFRDLSDRVPLFTWWNFRDFGDPRYKGVNSKGLETYGGFRKDVFYLFQAFLRPALPVVHLCGKTWFLRRSGSLFDPPGIKAYANVPALTLTVNGKSQGTVQNGSETLPDGTRVDNVFTWAAPLLPGRNRVTVDDGSGHTDSTVVYTEAGEINGDSTGLVRELTSSNPANPATFIDQPIQAEWPVYDDFDGTGDNTFHAIPALLQGAREIATGRPSKPGRQTALAFTLAPDAGTVDVFLMVTALPAPPAALLAGFTDTGVRGTWRDNALNLVPYLLYRRTVRGGQRVRIPSAARDYVVLIKPQDTDAGPAGHT